VDTFCFLPAGWSIMLGGFLLVIMVSASPVLAQCGSDVDGDGVCDPQDNGPSAPNPT